MQIFKKYSNALGAYLSFLLVLWSPITSFAFKLSGDCSTLTGIWEGTYSPQSGSYGQSGPWPIKFNIQYNPATKMLFGHADTPLIPSSVTPQGQISYISDQNAKIVGTCDRGKITKLFVYVKPPLCGHFAQPGGQIMLNRVLALNLEYESAMRDLNFAALLHKTSDTVTPSPIMQLAPGQLPKFPSCH